MNFIFFVLLKFIYLFIFYSTKLRNILLMGTAIAELTILPIVVGTPHETAPNYIQTGHYAPHPHNSQHMICEGDTEFLTSINGHDSHKPAWPQYSDKSAPSTGCRH